jgi:hypothetical protein
MTAWILAALGRTREAKERLLEVPLADPWSLRLMAGGEACVLLQDPTFGQGLYSSLARTANWMFFAAGPGVVIGPTARSLGDLALLLGRPAGALRHYDEALASCERSPFPILSELCRRARDEAALACTPPDTRSR